MHRLAQLNHARAVSLAEQLVELDGVEVLNESFFNEFTLRLPKPAAEVARELVGRGVLAGVPVSRLYPDHPELANLLLVASTETNSDKDVALFINALREVL